MRTLREELLARREWTAALGLGLLVAASYLPAVGGGFIWDDVIFSEEPVVHRWSGLWNIWFAPADIRNEGHYWPLVYTSFWLEHKLWGLAPAGYHIVNILLHWINTLLVGRLLSRLAVPGAWAAAAVFAVHPLHVESVAWVIERKDLLSALFYLAAALTWIDFVEAPTRKRYGLALLLYVAALLSKSVAVTLPAALLIWHGWQRQRIVARDLARLAPFFAVGLAIATADYLFYSGREPLALGYSLVERVLIAARALCFYAGKLLWPADLAVIYPLWDVHAGDLAGWLSLAAVTATATVLWLGRHRLGRGPLAALLFYAVTLAPMLGFIDYGYMQFSFVADRFQYLAGIAVMALAVGAAVRRVGRLPDALQATARAGFVAIVAVLAVLTWNQSKIYRDELVFYSHIVAHNPEAPDAHLGLGVALFEADRFEEGIAATRRVLEYRPDSVKALSNLGRGLLKQEALDEAGAMLERAVEIDPDNISARQNLGELRRKTKRYEEALAQYRAVLRMDPDYALAHGGMGAALFELGRYEEAAAAVARSLALQPDDPGAGTQHVLAGRSYGAIGKSREATFHFRRAMAIDPLDPRPVAELAKLRHEQGRGPEADALVEKAAALRSGDPAALHTTAEALRLRGRHERAIETYRAALAVHPEFAPAHAGLGIAMLEVGRHEEAIDSLAQAFRLDANLPEASALYVVEGRAHQALGQTGRAAASFERALRRDSRRVAALDRLAMIRYGQKRYGEALELYGTLTEIDPEAAQTHANRGATLYHLGRIAEALESFQRAHALDPDLEMAMRGAADMRRILAGKGSPP